MTNNMISFCFRKTTLWLIVLFFLGAAAGFAAGPAADDCGPQAGDGCGSQEILDSCEAASSDSGCEETKASSPAYSTGGEGHDASFESPPPPPDPGAARRPGLIREADARELNDSTGEASARTAGAAAVVLECAVLGLMGAGLVGISLRIRRRRPTE